MAGMCGCFGGGAPVKPAQGPDGTPEVGKAVAKKPKKERVFPGQRVGLAASDEEEIKVLEAARKGEVDNVTAALEAGASPMVYDPETGETLGDIVVKKGFVEVLKVLVEKKYSFPEPTLTFPSPAFVAVQEENKDVLEVLADAGLCAQDSAEMDRRRSIMHEAAKRNAALLSLVVRGGGDVDVVLSGPAPSGGEGSGRAGWYMTPLAFAVQHEKLDSIHVLVSLGADPLRIMRDARSGERTVLEYGKDSTNEAISSYFVALEKRLIVVVREEMIQVALGEESDRTTSRIRSYFRLMKGAFVDLKYKNRERGISVVHAACISNNVPVLDLLLKRKADMEDRDKQLGNTALLWAAMSGSTEAVGTLLARGAKLVDVQNHDGNTVLDCAILSENPDTLRRILETGIHSSLSTTDANDSVSDATAEILDVWDEAMKELHIKRNKLLITTAATFDCLDVLQSVVETYGADPKACIQLSPHFAPTTPLRAAFDAKLPENFQFLMGITGADHIQDPIIAGDTVVHCLAASNNEEGMSAVASYLRRDAAKRGIGDEGPIQACSVHSALDGLTPLHVGALYNSVEAVKVLVENIGASLAAKSTNRNASILALATKQNSHETVHYIVHSTDEKEDGKEGSGEEVGGEGGEEIGEESEVEKRRKELAEAVGIADVDGFTSLHYGAIARAADALLELSTVTSPQAFTQRNMAGEYAMDLAMKTRDLGTIRGLVKARDEAANRTIAAVADGVREEDPDVVDRVLATFPTICVLRDAELQAQSDKVMRVLVDAPAGRRKEKLQDLYERLNSARALFESALATNRMIQICGAPVDTVAGKGERKQLLHSLPRLLNTPRLLDGWTPLIAASASGDPAIVTELLHAGADPNLACAFDGVTPLIAAASHGRSAIVEQLLDAGANKRIRAFPGEAPVDVATTPLLHKILALEEEHDIVEEHMITKHIPDDHTSPSTDGDDGRDGAGDDDSEEVFLPTPRDLVHRIPKQSLERYRNTGIKELDAAQVGSELETLAPDAAALLVRHLRRIGRG